jgi:hypothetical protein
MIFRLLFDGSMLFGYIFAPGKSALLLRRCMFKGSEAQPRRPYSQYARTKSSDSKSVRIDCSLYETGGRYATFSTSARDQLFHTIPRIDYKIWDSAIIISKVGGEAMPRTAWSDALLPKLVLHSGTPSSPADSTLSRKWFRRLNNVRRATS